MLSDKIDFIHLLSYNLYRLHKRNSILVLSVVHIFAQLAGRKFLTSTSNSLLTSVVKSLVLVLENSHSPCSKCPLSEEVVSLDAVIFMLSERLQSLMETAKFLSTSNTQSSSTFETAELGYLLQQGCSQVTTDVGIVYRGYVFCGHRLLLGHLGRNESVPMALKIQWWTC
uniref:Uncharacterized protein n=1 Tax=Kalanchoe fedtschenkoi TaxID=63787 RepID=A0A7N0T0U1_KALFE